MVLFSDPVSFYGAPDDNIELAPDFCRFFERIIDFMELCILIRLCRYKSFEYHGYFK
jgi:hypothetical protein